MATEIQLPNFMSSNYRDNDARLKWHEAQRQSDAIRFKREKVKLVFITALLSSAFAFTAAAALNGLHVMPVLRVTFYTPGDL